MTITQEQQKIIDEAKLIAEANPDLDLSNGEYEQRYKDTQASFTKARQQEIELARLLVEQDPANIDKITNEVVKNKILNDKYGVDNIEELKVLFPDYAKNGEDDGQDQKTEMEKLQSEMNLMKYQNTKTKTKDALDSIALINKEVVDTIPSFKEKMEDELKFISEKVEPSERVKKAFSLVVGSLGSSADAYSIMQGITMKKTPKTDVDDASLKKAQNEYRRMLGLKEK